MDLRRLLRWCCVASAVLVLVLAMGGAFAAAGPAPPVDLPAVLPGDGAAPGR